MTIRTRILAAIGVGVVILVLGVAYAAARPLSYTSDSRLVLVPRANSTTSISDLTSSFTASGTAGTFVELIASTDTLKSAGASGLSAGVRAVPDSRVVSVALEGDKNRVQPALNRLLAVAREKQRNLNDSWTSQILEAAQPPVASGPSSKLIVIASVFLAVFGGILVLVALQRFGSSIGPSRPVPFDVRRDDRDDDEDDEDLFLAPQPAAADR